MFAHHKKLILRAGLGAGASLVALSAAAPAFAQDDTSDQGGAHEIVVTAQFREQKLQDTPLAITAVDAALMEARNQDDIEAVARQAPSVTLQQMGGAYGNSMGASIRGIGQFDFNPAYEPGVGMYVDDVYYASLTGANFDLLDLERVEVLRGPQGTLTGRNSIGGAIKLFSQKPTDENSGNVQASYGSRNRLELRGGANFALTDNLYARFSGVHKEQDGYVDQIDYGCANPGNPEGILQVVTTGEDCVVAKLGDTNYSGVRGALRYEGSAIDIQVIADYQKSSRHSSAEVPILATGDASNFICGKWCTYASWYLPEAGMSGNWSQTNRNEFEGWGVSGHIDYDVSDSVQIQSITAYRSYNNQWGSDDDFTPTLTRAAGGYNDLSMWFFSQELRVNAEIGDIADLTVGGYYSDQQSVYYTIQDIRYLGPVPLQFQGNDPINADTKAAFGTVILHPATDFNITAGIRYTDEHKDYTFVRKQIDGSDGTIGFGIDALDGLTSVYDGDRFDWRVSADYRFNDQVLGYVTVGTGFKGGGVTARPFIPQHAIDGTFGPETVTAYELGIKTDLFDRAVRFNVAGFYNEYNDIQLPLSDCTEYGGGPCAVVANAGDGKIWGVEAELFAEPVEGLMIDASASLMDSQYDSVSAAVGSSAVLADPLVTPEFQASAGIQYTADLGGSNGTLTPRFDIAHRGKTFSGHALDSVSTDYQWVDAYTLGNARLTWRNADEDLAVSLEVTNVFDTYYNPFRFDAVYAFAGTAYAQVGAPREWRISVSKDF